MHTLIFDNSHNIQDIEIQKEGKNFLLLGASGATRELSLLKNIQVENNCLYVFIGLGLGHAVLELADKTKHLNAKIAIIDKEDFLEDAKYKEAIKAILDNPNIIIISEKSPIEAIKKLLTWRQENNNLAFEVLQNSQYYRIDRDYYKNIEKQIEIVEKDSFWKNFSSKPFSKKNIKVLFTLNNELIFDLMQACEQLNIEYRCLNVNAKDFDAQKYSNSILDALIEFKPDMILTMNHLGIDQDGAMVESAKKANVPIVSILLDSPYLMLSNYPHIRSEILSVFTYDDDTVPLLKEMGYTYVDYLPLGTNKERFHPRNKNNPYPNKWDSDVSFVGTSLRKLVFSRIAKAKLPHIILRKYKEIANAFIFSDLHIVKDFLAKDYPEFFTLFNQLSVEEKLDFEKIITWESTRQYRLSCVEQTLSFEPSIIGDKNWHNNIKNKGKFRYLGSVPYADIADFYTHSVINFNTTSMQMKNAVNQRVFDVPVSNAFIITDWRKQMDNLLESGKEIISYKEKEEVPELIKYYLKNENARNKIIEAGRKRILAEHTWEKRLLKVIEIMRKRYN